MLTPQIVDLVGRGVYDMNMYLKNKSKEDLDYDGEKQSMEEMIKSCIDWLQSEGMLCKNLEVAQVKYKLKAKEVNNRNSQSNNFNHEAHEKMV